MKRIIVDILNYFLNHIVIHIPFWTIRKLTYRMTGMKIGKNSRILMGTQIICPWKITLRDGVYVNERCILDGRGGIDIGNNVSISLNTVIITGTHITNSDTFEFAHFPITIEDNVWVGVSCIILPGAILRKGMVLAAGSVAIKKEYETMGIYSGVPAVRIGDRQLDYLYQLGNWKPLLR